MSLCVSGRGLKPCNKEKRKNDNHFVAYHMNKVLSNTCFGFGQQVPQFLIFFTLDFSVTSAGIIFAVYTVRKKLPGYTECHIGSKDLSSATLSDAIFRMSEFWHRNYSSFKTTFLKFPLGLYFHFQWWKIWESAWNLWYTTFCASSNKSSHLPCKPR